MKKTAQLLIKLSPELRDALKSHAQRHGRSASELVRHLIEDEIRSARTASMLAPELVNGKFGPAAQIQTQDGQLYHVRVQAFQFRANLELSSPAGEYINFNSAALRGKSDQLDRVLQVMDTVYEWDTPAYRQICFELGLDPDTNRPTYKEHDKFLVADLEQRINWSGGGDDRRLNDLICDLITLLRTDQAPEFYSYVKSKQILDHWSFKTSKSVFEDAFCRIDLDRISSSQPVLSSIDFLPSWAGRGYSASIYLWHRADCEQDGWCPTGYGHVSGVALSPSRSDIAIDTVVRRLKEQGVIFLTDSEAREYLDQEGAYWAYQQKSWRCPHGFQPRSPSASELFVWPVKRPATPFYRLHLEQQRR